MNTIILLVFASVSLAAPLAGQVRTTQVGVTGGLAIATLEGDPDAGSRSAPYFGGVIVVQDARSPLGFESGAIYVPKGAETTLGVLDGTLRLSYVEVPLLLRVRMDMTRTTVTPVFLFGGSFGFRAACEFVYDSGSTTTAADCEDAIFAGIANFKSVDFGLSGGFAVDIPVGQRSIVSPSGRLTWGLTDISETTDADINNRVIQLGITVRLVL